MIPVVKLSYHEPEISRDAYWDHALLNDLVGREFWTPPQAVNYGEVESLEGCEGAVVVVPARHHAKNVDRLNADLMKLRWALLVLTGDEEHAFPLHDLIHPNLKTWVMTPPTPWTEAFRGLDRFRPMVNGYAPGVERFTWVQSHRRHLWSFMGQVNHGERLELFEALLRRPTHEGIAFRSDGFGSGMPHETYLIEMVNSKVVPCPGGWHTPDTFRLWEALEMGCVPVTLIRHDPYFESVLGDFPWTRLGSWSDLDVLFDNLVWPWDGIKCSSWWQGYRRKLAYALDEDVRSLAGTRNLQLSPTHFITVVVTTSPIPSHPSIEILTETVASVRASLPNAEILIMCDGVRPEQEPRRGAYEDAVYRICGWTNRQRNMLPIVSDRFVHQANLMRRALEEVHTPLVLFVEHDTPLVNDFNWSALVEACLKDDVNCIRFMHESRVLDDHRHLMLADEPRDVSGVPLLPTRQWSQRPHLAKTEWYRGLIAENFGRASRTFIEEVMAGVADVSGERLGLYIFHPEGNIQRSAHLYGRGTDPMYPCAFAYDGDTPEGAPYPTATRVD